MKEKRTKALVLLVVLCIILPMLVSSASAKKKDKPDQRDRKNLLDNPGFETGDFAPWVNEKGTAYNQITTANVFLGDYSLWMDSHYSSSPYEPVTQALTTDVRLTPRLVISAAIYPTITGPTCGQAGASLVQVNLLDMSIGVETTILYEWSGYTFPNHDLGSNTTRAIFLLFHWAPNEWHRLERFLLDDYAAVFGPPADPSQLKVTGVYLLCHSSNGDPGDFYADDFYLGPFSGKKPKPPK